MIAGSNLGLILCLAGIERVEDGGADQSSDGSGRRLRDGLQVKRHNSRKSFKFLPMGKGEEPSYHRTSRAASISPVQELGEEGRSSSSGQLAAGSRKRL